MGKNKPFESHKKEKSLKEICCNILEYKKDVFL